jgi:hypothetical protein
MREASRARHLRGAMKTALSLSGDGLKSLPSSQRRESLLDSILADLISGRFQKSPSKN